MFFDEDMDPDLFHVVHQEFYTINSDLEIARYGLRSIPTHTEDGIPIRKLYVSNLPAKTTRTELFGIFAQYGFIKSCWLRITERGPKRTPYPTYAFVTFTNPADAHKALQAPHHEKILRGRVLKISPADSWHQPPENSEGRVRWKPRAQRQDGVNTDELLETLQHDATPTLAETSIDSCEINGESSSTGPEESLPENEEYNILDILNNDCISHILTYVPIRDLIRSERVSKRWQNMVLEYLEGIRTFKTSSWKHDSMILTTAILRRILQRLGGSLTRLHIDHHWSALNDRTAHTVGKFCPNLEELKVVGMYTKNWNPLIYGCKELKTLSFITCNKLTDGSLVHLVKRDSCIESLTVANNTHVTGLFLTGSYPSKLNYLAFYNCYSLQGTVLSAAIDTLPSLKTLKLDVGPLNLWKIIPLILNKLPQLEELSLSEYTSLEVSLTPQGSKPLCEAFETLTELKILNISRNIYISNAVLKQIATSCTKLESLNISCCNATKNARQLGVGDDGIQAICSSCSSLRSLDVSYLSGLSGAGVTAVSKCTALVTLTARGNGTLTAAPFATCIENCHALEELDLCGCDSVTEEVAEAAARALSGRPAAAAAAAGGGGGGAARLLLRLAGTAAAHHHELATHKRLTVNVTDDRCNPHLRPDFVDRLFEDSSEESLDNYDLQQYADFIGAEDDRFLVENFDEYDDEDVYELEWEFNPRDIILI